MKQFKKLMAVLLVGSLALVGCGSSDSSSSSSDSSGSADKIVVWTLAQDLEQFGKKFSEDTGIDVETVVIAPADYLTKVQSALLGGATEPDVIVAEPQMLATMYDAGFFEDLNQEPYNAQQYSDLIVDYVWEVGQDDDGIQRAISYQITPAGMFYRRDIAMDVYGTDDPEFISTLFKDYPTIYNTAIELRDAGYRIFASDGEMGVFAGDDAWVVDGVLNLSQARIDYMDLAVALYQDDLTAYASQWSAPWYQAMKGEVPILTAETNVWDSDAVAETAANSGTTEIFAFGLPSWGVLTLRDNTDETFGLWGVAEGPSSGFAGGSFIGINSNSKKKDTAWEFVKYCTLDADVMEWWIDISKGDTVAHIPTLEKYSDVENENFGGQQLYQFWLEQAQEIDYSVVTQYDTAIGNAWGDAINSVKIGEKTKEEAINYFYDVVASTYPQIQINR
ncbi:MAG: sugar ABC transporter substrate-binding protein [Epulopiscium sp. Nele67-Bin002]|nr:MAG: sugar ABC transporter substrate-binding protein [Epulopiscium sp. Nele67-Bin002]OON93619.1 MAG: sugar ABC transporter substrate-binding protein [Epulopiscium sp. Nele67-Bin001]